MDPKNCVPDYVQASPKEQYMFMLLARIESLEKTSDCYIEEIKRCKDVLFTDPVCFKGSAKVLYEKLMEAKNKEKQDQHNCYREWLQNNIPPHLFSKIAPRDYEEYYQVCTSLTKSYKMYVCKSILEKNPDMDDDMVSFLAEKIVV